MGHSNVVGKPLAAMMLNRNATVQVCHVFTRDLAEHTRDAEISGGGGRSSWLDQEGDGQGREPMVFDVGINRVGDKTVGDVDFEAVKGGGLGHNARSGWSRAAHSGHAARPDRLQAAEEPGRA